jgi:hypothetical protein
MQKFLESDGSNGVATIGAILTGMGMYGVYMVMIRGFKPEDLARLPFIRSLL